MLNAKLILKYTKGLPSDYFIENRQPLPSFCAMAWCMTATGFSRIFTKEDMKEFLFRLAITLESMDLLKDGFQKDKLIDYSFRGQKYCLNLNDIIMYFGFELLDTYYNCRSREEYLGDISGRIGSADLVGIIDGFLIINPAKVDKVKTGPRLLSELINRTPVKVTDIPIQMDEPEKENSLKITPELISKAEFFADELMDFIPEKTYDEQSMEMIEKEMELYVRMERVKHLPDFDIHKISPEIIRQCFEIMYSNEYVHRLLADRCEFEKSGHPMIYLAWLWANDFMEQDGNFVYEKEGFTINQNDYSPDGYGCNLLKVIAKHNITKTVPLLKGLLI